MYGLRKAHTDRAKGAREGGVTKQFEGATPRVGLGEEKFGPDECIRGKRQRDGERARRKGVGGVGEETAELSF